MVEFETPLQVGHGLLTTAYIYAIEFRIFPTFEKLYMKKNLALVDRYRKKELGK